MVVRIDGSVGEGGGQILRTSLALAALLSREVEIVNIRRGRKVPGLQPQHLTAVRAIRDITRGRTLGDELGSELLIFRPGTCDGGVYEFDVSKIRASAGSVSLIFQTVLPALLFAPRPTHLILRGGTHVPFSPPTTYVERVFLPALRRMGGRASLKTVRWGWYPQGGGIVEADIEPVERLSAVELTRREELVKIEGLAVVSNLPLSIAERFCRRLLQRLAHSELVAEVELLQAPASGKGAGLFAFAYYGDVVAGFSALGEVGKRAETVADEVHRAFMAHHRSGKVVERHLADQLLLYMALAEGRSTMTVSEITTHLVTNVWVIEQFLPVKFEVDGEVGRPGVISVEGVGFRPGATSPEGS
jgi:RNA 3'-terminal phosphate cyclase (ATP)